MRFSLLLCLFLFSADGSAQDELVEAGLSEVELERFREGVTALEDERFKDAQGRFWRVHLTNREHPQTLAGLGFAYRGEGEFAEAAKWFEQCAHLLDDCALAAAQLAILDGEFDQAIDRLSRLSGEQGELKNPLVHWALMEAYVGGGQFAEALTSALEFVQIDYGDEPWIWKEEQSTQLATLLTGLRMELSSDSPWVVDESGRWQDCLTLLAALNEMDLPADVKEEIGVEVLRIEVEEAARRRFGGIDVALSNAQAEEVKRIRNILEAGDWAGATLRIDALIAETPRSAEAWGLRGQVYQAHTDVNSWAEAEKSYRRARRLAPNISDWGVALVALLTEGYGGRRDEEAVPVLREMVGTGPSAAFQIQLGELLRKTGDHDGAIEVFEAYLLKWPNGVQARFAREAIQSLKRVIPTANALRVPVPIVEGSLRQGAQWQYHLSVVYQGRSLGEKAIAHASAAVELQPDWPLGLNHLAGLLSDVNPQAALDYVDQSLALSPRQDRIRLQRIDLLFRLGKLKKAEGALVELAGDAPEFYFQLAVLEQERGQLGAAQVQLEQYFERYSGEQFREEAALLRDALAPEKPSFLLPIVGGLVCSGGLGFVLFRRRRRRKGISMHVFLREEPRCFHDVARVLAGMRHEVLKHNTTLLPAVAEALERGDRGPALDASGILIGGQGADGVITLWERYIAELEAIGQSHGRRLSLRYTDPQIAPMCQAFRSLRQLAPQLHKAKPQTLVPQIRSISHALNTVGYAELGKLLHEVCVLEIDRAVLEAAWRRIAREPGLVGRGLEAPVLSLECEVQVRVFREDLVDILANLLRNACDAVLENCAEEERRVGIRIVEEMDFVTGLSWVAIRVLDSAPGPLTDAMLKDRQIGRGVGLAMDLAKRSQGSLKVEDEPGWAKAVVLRLAVAEEVDS